MKHYILDEHGQPVPEPDLLTWAQWFEEHGMDRVVIRTEVDNGSYVVSTVFLGIDHQFGDDGEPVLWETLVFGLKEDFLQWRYTSRELALEGHFAAVAYARAAVASVSPS